MGGDHLWEAIGAIGEAFSAIALFFVLVQVRHARSETARAITQGRLQVVRDLFLARVSNPALNELYERAADRLASPSGPAITAFMEQLGMTRSEATTLSFDQLAWWTYRQEQILYIDLLPPGERFAFDTAIRGMFAPGSVTRLWYDHSRPMLNPDAVRYVDNLLASPA